MRDERTSDWWIFVIVALVFIVMARPLMNISASAIPGWGKESRSPPAELELSDTIGRSALSDDDDDASSRDRHNEFSFLLKRSNRRPTSAK